MLIGSPFVGGHIGMLQLRELACVNMSDGTCKSQKSSKHTSGHTKVYKSTRHWYKLLRLQMSVNVKGCSVKSPLEKPP